MIKKWWEDPNVKLLFAVGQAFTGTAIDGQIDGWMLEGIFETEMEAVRHCTEYDYFVIPIPVGMMTGRDLPDGIYWPRLQSKKEGQARVEEYRKQQKLKITEN